MNERSKSLEKGSNITRNRGAWLLLALGAGLAYVARFLGRRRSSPASAGFQKRIYNVETLRGALDEVFAHVGDLRSARRSGRVDAAFAERIMLAVTKVNGCRYCNYGHTRAALRAGVTDKEIRGLIAGDFAALPAPELVALTYAQHYAETAGHPDAAAWHRLIETYGADGARDILAYIRMITMGNLLGNTFDALLSRLSGGPTAAGSSLGQELGVLLGLFFLPPALWAARLAQRAY
jgi:AhpD family alkylhydroperoxidase